MELAPVLVTSVEVKGIHDVFIGLILMVFSMAGITANFGLKTKGVGTQTSIVAKAVTNSVKPVNIGFWLLIIIMMLSGDVFKRNGYWK